MKTIISLLIMVMLVLVDAHLLEYATFNNAVISSVI